MTRIQYDNNLFLNTTWFVISACSVVWICSAATFHRGNFHRTPSLSVRSMWQLYRCTLSSVLKCDIIISYLLLLLFGTLLTIIVFVPYWATVIFCCCCILQHGVLYSVALNTFTVACNCITL